MRDIESILNQKYKNPREIPRVFEYVFQIQLIESRISQ